MALQTFFNFLSLPTIHEKNKENDCCLGSAIECAYKIMEPIGGKVIVLNFGLPNMGLGKKLFTKLSFKFHYLSSCPLKRLTKKRVFKVN